jgi:hypothetical protein
MSGALSRTRTFTAKSEVFLWRTAALGCFFAGEGACSPFSYSAVMVI